MSAAPLAEKKERPSVEVIAAFERKGSRLSVERAAWPDGGITHSIRFDLKGPDGVPHFKNAVTIYASELAEIAACLTSAAERDGAKT